LVFEELLVMRLEEFEKDKNMGLIKKLAKVFRQPLRIRLVELSDTYLTLKTSEIDTSTYNKNVLQPTLEHTLFDMITSGQVQAKLDERQAMISFIESSNSQSSSDYLSVVEAIEAQNTRIIQLMEQVQKVDMTVKTSKEYIQRDLQGIDKTGSGFGSSAAQAIDESSGGDLLMRR